MIKNIQIKTQLTHEQIRSILPYIEKTCTEVLAPRPLTELKKKLERKNILMAFDREELLGWLLINDYSKIVQELCGVYVKPKYRHRGVFSCLLKAAMKRKPNSVAVTFSHLKALPVFLNFGWQEISLRQTIKATGFKFILERLKLARLQGIFAHSKQGKIRYLIYVDK